MLCLKGIEMTEQILIKQFKCRHNKYIVGHGLAYVECGLCGEKLEPMWVLGQMCSSQNRLVMHLDELVKDAEKAKGKNRCKCEKCGQMTRITK
jgi:ribosomal protein S27E